MAHATMPFRPSDPCRHRGRWPLRIATGLACGFLVLVSTTTPVQALPPDFAYQNSLTGLDQPTAVRFARDGRVFIAEKRGVILVYDSLLDATPQIFADLRTNTHNYWDRGLLGMALHPDFPEQPYVYVAYTYDGGIVDDAPRWGTAGIDNDGCPDPTAFGAGCVVSGRLSRLVAGGDQALSEVVLIRDWHQQYPGYSMGGLAFGVDGYLYAGSGTGASGSFVDYGQADNLDWPDVGSPANEGGALRAQDIETDGDPLGLSGAVIRVDPMTGLGAEDNPLDGPSENDRRIVAYGLRNPFRVTVRPGTNELWIADVGWNLYEEINVLPDPGSAGAPLNYGWPCYEGSDPQGGYEAAELPICQALYAGNARFPLTGPWLERLHGSGDGAITALVFHTGGSYPTQYHGALFYADYVGERIYTLHDTSGDGVPEIGTLSVFAEGSSGIVDLHVGPGGDLFIAQILAGRLVRIVYGDNTPPSAALVLAPGSFWVGGARRVHFDASRSIDPDNGSGNPAEGLLYHWDLDGDGDFDDGDDPLSPFADRFFSTLGEHRVALRVTDTAGASDTVSMRIFVGSGSGAVQIVQPQPDFHWRSGAIVALEAIGSDAQDQPFPDDAYLWTVNLLHCVSGPNDCHSHQVTTLAGRIAAFVAPEHEYPSYLRIGVTASGDAGMASAEVEIAPETAQVTLSTQPAGLKLAFGSDGAMTTPFTHTVIVGSGFSVAAPSVQTMNGIEWAFESWSDGGARQHTATAPDPGPYSLVASYTAMDSTLVFRDGFEVRP